MTREQFQCEKRLAREQELQMLAQGRIGADPRYVKDFVAWVWSKVLERKLQMSRFEPGRQARRVRTLAGLYS
jgi:hypothetical protein